MRITIAALALSTSLLLAGCGAHTVISPTPATTGNATVNFVVTDTPPANLTVLSFQVQIASAVLQPGNVSILQRPVTVDLAQLVSDTGLLASSVIGSGTYTSLTMTYANPQVTFMNNAATAVTAGGQSCAAGATCTFTPALNNASVTISTGVFPLTVTASSTTGLNLDLSIPDLLQSDLSMTFANGTSVNLSVLPQPSSLTATQSQIADVLGIITATSSSSVSITTAFGDTLVLTPGTATRYNYPAAICSSQSAACLAVGQIVTTDLGLLGNGALSLNALSYAGASGATVVKALVLSTNSATPSAQVLLQRSINATSLSAGQIATVNLTGATYAVGAASYPGVSGGTFTSSLDLMPGQEVVLNVGGNLVTGSTPSFTAASLYLEPSQVIGQIATVSTASTSVTVNALAGLFTASRPVIQQMNIQTDSTTAFTGFSAASFTALAKGQFVAAKGPLFNTTGNAGSPTLSAIQFRARTVGN